MGKRQKVRYQSVAVIFEMLFEFRFRGTEPFRIVVFGVDFQADADKEKGRSQKRPLNAHEFLQRA